MTVQDQKEILLEHPHYVLHPTTEKQMTENGIKVDYQEMGLVDYADYIRAKPPNAPISSKFTSATRVRSARRDREFIVWDEIQEYVDPLGNVVRIKRLNCGIYNTIAVKRKTVPDPEVGTRQIVADWKMIPLYEYEFRKEYANQILKNSDNVYEMFFYIMEERSNERPRTFKQNDFDKWRDWSFDALYEFATHPRSFGTEKELNDRRMDPDSPDQDRFIQVEHTQAEMFGTAEKRKEAVDKSKQKK